jgi:hypothetical protein
MPPEVNIYDVPSLLHLVRGVPMEGELPSRIT